MHESEEMSVRIESVTTERGLGEPNRITIELTDWAGLFRRPRRPGVYTDDARRGYDYEGTAEEIVEIDGPRKELPSG